MSDQEKIFWEYNEDENPWHPRSPEYSPLYESIEIVEEVPDCV